MNEIKKANIQWSEKMSVGISSIDTQHKAIINIINTLFNNYMNPQEDQSAIKTFTQMDLYVHEHFQYEEKLFEEYNWPGKNEHKNHHAMLIKRLEGLKDQALVLSDEQSSLLLMEFLKDFVQTHILEEDKKYAPFLIEKGVK